MPVQKRSAESSLSKPKIPQEEDGMGEFEDPWEDEYDSDGSSVVVNASSDQDDQDMGTLFN